MTNQHPITPTPELLEQWEAETAHTTKDETWHVAVQAARWGADQELEAICKWVVEESLVTADDLRHARRPKSPTLKEQALALINSNKPYLDDTAMDTIRRALEALPND